MPTFRYKAYDNGGKLTSGDIDASGVRDAAEKLRSAGLHPSDVSVASSARGLFGGRPVSVGQLSLTTRQLSTLLSSGTTLSEALSVLVENSASPRFKSVLLDVKEKVAEGVSLSRALEAHPEVFSTLYRGLVASGESSGSLDAVLTRLADYLEARARIGSEVKAALTYPALMTVVGAGVLSFLFIFVIPKITRMFEEAQSALPIATVVLIAISNLLRTFWPLLIVLAAALAWGFKRYRDTRPVKRALGALVLTSPVIGPLATSFYVSNMTRTLGSLLRDGVHLLRAIEITREVVDNSVFDGILAAARGECMEGASLSSSLKKHKAIPPIVVHMVSVGEKSGNLDQMLLKTGESYDLEFQAGVKRTLNLLEPLLILAMGLIVGFIVLAILLPIFNLNQIIR